jgi:uncharacterized protein (TIGR00730 family)
VIVTVFGSANARPGDALYESAYTLGGLLAQQGHSLVTGGYGGTMEAVSRGASEKGAATIGVTCAEIEKFRPGGANAWVAVEFPTESLTGRLEQLTRMADICIALPGGVGTLCEAALTLNLMAIGAIKARVLILVGPAWKESFELFFSVSRDFINNGLAEHLRFAQDAAEAARMAATFTDK